MPLNPLLPIGFLLLASPLAWGQIVTNTNTSGPGSLREAVAVAVANFGGTITFAPGLSGQTISLGGSEILLDEDLTIDASALPGGITLTQPPFSLNPGSPPPVRIFTVPDNQTPLTVTLKGLHLTGAGFVPFGGAILNYGNLFLTGCSLTGNYAGQADRFAGLGGAIANAGSLYLNNCTLAGNGALDAEFRESGQGGAIYNVGTLSIQYSTITNNFCNSSFGNFNPMTNSRVLIPGKGGGVYCDTSGSLFLLNSIVAGNNAAQDSNISGAYTEDGNNLVSGDPKLEALGNYGGPTPTMPPRSDSPCLNAGSNLLLFLLPTDQRRRPRLSGAFVDIGAVELLTTTVTNLNDAGPGSLRQALGVSGTDPAGNFITFAAGLSGQPIDLTGGPLVLGNYHTTIDASALPGGVRLNGYGRVVEVPSGVTATLRALTLQNGYHISEGGGVYNAGALTLDRCTIANNGVSGESLTPLGGGIYNAGNLIIDQCTIAANQARSGSGIFNPDGAALTIRQSTIAGNESEISTAGMRNNGALTLFNSIVAGNNGSGLSPNFHESGTVVRSGNNITDGDPMLMPLGNYGGPTQTMPPQPGSPARNAGATGGPGFAFDQRGFPRMIGPAVDLGAVEEIPGQTQIGANMADIWLSDADGDGKSFGIEYAVGTDPFTPDAGAAGRLGISLDPAKRITFGRNPAAIPNTEWILKRSFDLQPGTFTEIYRFHGPTGFTAVSGVTGAIQEGNGFTITDPTTADRAFYRLETRFTP